MLYYCSLPRTVIRVTGRDRQKFLHNFCTADITGMVPGQIREAMVLDSKGKLLGLVHVFCGDEWLELNTVPHQAEALIAHLDRYIIREDVQLEDHSAACAHTVVFGLGGGTTATLETGLEKTSGWNSWRMETVGGAECMVAEADFAGPSRLYRFPAGLEPFSPGKFVAGDEFPADANALTLHRVAAGCPWFGVDCDNGNLPQELQRDDVAISFTKGCYLGQETVARIDALGHVNRLLVVVRSELPGDLPASGMELREGEKAVGQITSPAMADSGQWTALAIVRRAAAQGSHRLESESGTVLVSERTST